MKVLDLFSGIGGFSLGLERAGMETVAFCEIEPFCRKVLRKHWPDVPIFEDVRELSNEVLRNAGIVPDVICGGFPCQDISLAGKGAGITGERSGLWKEYARLIGEIRPRYVIVENVAALLSRGLGDVLSDLAALGYDAEWHCIPAYEAGLPHKRNRTWLVAYRYGMRQLQPDWGIRNQWGWAIHSIQETLWSFPFSARGRDTDGVSARLDALGNAVVPQIPEIIGRAIMAIENE